jgi:hypothetical protein
VTPAIQCSRFHVFATEQKELVKQKPAISTTGKGVGRKSQCEPLAEVILAKAAVGLSAQRIYQDLVEENGFTDSY